VILRKYYIVAAVALLFILANTTLICAQKPESKLKLIIQEDGSVLGTYTIASSFETNETGSLKLYSSINLYIDSEELKGDIVYSTAFEKLRKYTVRPYMQFRIKLSSKSVGEGETYSSKVNGALNIAFSQDSSSYELSAEIVDLSITIDENNVTTIKGVLNIFSSDPMLLMFMMMVNKDQLNEKLRESGIDYVRVENLNISVVEENMLKVSFLVSLDINKLTKKMEKEESRKSIWNIIEVLKHKHSLESYLEVYFETSNEKNVTKGEFNLKLNWHYLGDVEELKEIFEKTSESEEAITIPPSMENRISKEDVWEVLNVTREFLENVEIKYPAEISFLGNISVSEGKGDILIKFTAPQLKAKYVGGAEGAENVLKYLGRLLTIVNSELEKVAKREESENIRILLEALIPEKVSLEPGESDKYVIKVKPQETTIDKLDEVDVEIEAKSPIMGVPLSTEGLGIATALVAIGVIAAVLFKRK